MEDHTYRTDESMVMYASWFDYLLTLGLKTFSIAMVAVVCILWYSH